MSNSDARRQSARSRRQVAALRKITRCPILGCWIDNTRGPHRCPSLLPALERRPR